MANLPPGGPPPGPSDPPPGDGAPAQGAAPPAPGMPPVPAGMVAAVPQVEYPIKMYAYYPADGQVGRSSFRGLRTLPHVIALAFIAIGVAFARLYAWFVILFTGRLPENVFNFELGYLRWAARVAAYRAKLTAIPPPFGLDDDPNYPVRIEAVYPQSIPRWHVFVSGIMLIPHYVMLAFLGAGAAFGALFGSFAVLFTGRYPPGVFRFVLGTMRWRFRVHGFRWHWTNEYPPFSLD